MAATAERDTCSTMDSSLRAHLQQQFDMHLVPSPVRVEDGAASGVSTGAGLASGLPGSAHERGAREADAEMLLELKPALNALVADCADDMDAPLMLPRNLSVHSSHVDPHPMLTMHWLQVIL